MYSNRHVLPSLIYRPFAIPKIHAKNVGEDLARNIYMGCLRHKTYMYVHVYTRMSKIFLFISGESFQSHLKPTIPVLCVISPVIHINLQSTSCEEL